MFKELTKLHEKNYYGLINDVILSLKDDEKTSLGEYTFILEKEGRILEKNEMSIEALLVNEMIKENLSLKDATNKLNNDLDDISKKDIYNAGLNLKRLFKD